MSFPISGNAGPISVSLIPAGYIGVWDYNNDGRVNEQDLLDLEILFVVSPVLVSGSSDPLAAFDFNGDGYLDASDTAIMNQFFATVNQGVAGDDTGDGYVNCDDLVGVLAHQFVPRLTVCDSAYRVEFDADLDGDNDLDDQTVILRLIQPADLNADGELDFLDILIFVAAHAANESIADLNGDGFYDALDFSAFTASVNAPCP